MGKYVILSIITVVSYIESDHIIPYTKWDTFESEKGQY